MMSLNKVILMGRITKNPERNLLQNDKSVIRFTVAVDRNYKDKDGNIPADFINVVAWNRLAEIVEKYAAKGTLIAVVGNLRTRTYKNSEGKTVYTTEVFADEIQLLSSPKNTQQNQNASTKQTQQKQQKTEQQTKSSQNMKPAEEDFKPIDDENFEFDDEDFVPINDEYLPF